MNILNTKSLISLSLLLALTACQPHSQSGPQVPKSVGNTAKPDPATNDVPGKSESSQNQPNQSQLAKEFSIQMVKEVALNTYSIHIQSNLNVHDYEVYRSLEKEEQGDLVKVLDSAKDTFIEKADTRNYADRYVHYTVVVDQEVVKTVSFHIKPDLVVDGDFYVNQRLPNNTYNLSRLILKNRARLFVEQSDISFTVDLFESENGEIISFNPEYKNTKNGLDAFSSGHVSIKAEVIRGNLKVDLRGADGVKGETGVASTQQGAKGLPGLAETSVKMRQCVPSVYRSIGPEMSLGRDCLDYYVCATAATSGKAGEPGGKGGPGKRGGNAGNGGSLTLVANTADLFSLDFDTSAGLPGQRGDGGAGGPGGQGGDPGPRGSLCAFTATAGGVGPQGPEGDKGDLGGEGANGTVDIEIKSMRLKMNDVKGRI